MIVRIKTERERQPYLDSNLPDVTLQGGQYVRLYDDETIVTKSGGAWDSGILRKDTCRFFLLRLDLALLAVIYIVLKIRAQRIDVLKRFRRLFPESASHALVKQEIKVVDERFIRLKSVDGFGQGQRSG